MKTRVLLLGICTLFAGAISAQENLLVNGGFEDGDGIVTFNHDGHQCPEYIPGWDHTMDDNGVAKPITSNEFNNQGFSKWNVFGFINDITDADLEGTGADLIPADDFAYLRLQRYQWNGWYAGYIQQTVEVVPGETYTLSCLYRVNAGGTRDKQPAKRCIQVYEASKNDAGGIVKGAMVFEQQIEHKTVDWTAFSQSGIKTDSQDHLIIVLGLNGAGGEGDGMPANENVTIDFDEVQFVKSGGSSISSIDADNNISVFKSGSDILVNGVKAGDKVALYDVTGILLNSDVATSDDYKISVVGQPKGIYLIKVGNVSKKIVL